MENRITQLRKSKGITQGRLAKILSLTQSAYCNYEKGIRQIPDDVKIKLATYFGVSVDYLLGRTDLPLIADELDLQENYAVPIIGHVVAGVPIETPEYVDGYIMISFRPKEEYFALRVHGKSMTGAGIPDRAVLVVHKQRTAEDGDIIVAMLNGEQTVKRYKNYGGGTIFLVPENPEFEPMPVLDKDELLILGKVVEIRITL